MNNKTPNTIVFIDTVKIGKLFVHKTPNTAKRAKKHKESCLLLFHFRFNLPGCFSLRYFLKIDGRRAE